MSRLRETPAIDARGVTVAYSDTTALDGVDLAVDPGRICGLLGANGANRNTALGSADEEER